MNNVTDWLNADLEIPTSCCNVNMTCITEQYSKGCSSAVLNLVQTQLVAVAAVGIAFLVGEVCYKYDTHKKCIIARGVFTVVWLKLPFPL